MKVFKSFLHAIGLTIALSIISMMLSDQEFTHSDIFMLVPVILALGFPITWRLFYVRLEKKSAKESTIKESDAPVVPNESIEENAGALDLEENVNAQALQALRFFRAPLNIRSGD